jgi:hypothetical protein
LMQLQELFFLSFVCTQKMSNTLTCYLNSFNF